MSNHNKIVHFIARFRGVFFSMALLILLASCMDEDDNFVSEPVDVAYVSIYHAAPNAPEFDIVVDGRLINRNPFDYASYSGYLNFFTGDREIRFNPVNADNSLIDTTFNFEDGKAYSVFAVDKLSEIEALLVVDSADAPAEGKAMVRFIHLSPDAPAFDVAIGEGEAPLFADRSFKEATPYKEIDADTYTFDVRNTGEAEAVLSTANVDILAGRFYTIVTRGFANPPEGNDHVLSVEILD